MTQARNSPCYRHQPGGKLSSGAQERPLDGARPGQRFRAGCPDVARAGPDGSQERRHRTGDLIHDGNGSRYDSD